MPKLLERTELLPPVQPDGTLHEHDERASRAALRGQIAAMDAELGQLFESAFTRTGFDFRVPAPDGGPRILSVDELERVRDALATRLPQVRRRLDECGRVEERSRALLELMTADPSAHKWVRVANADIGEPGCRHWHSRPRWGPLGLLLGWWRVKVSSGCPLGPGPAAGGSRAKTRARFS